MALSTRRSLLMGTAGLAPSRRLAAQEAWPARPVTIVVPLAPGGASEVLVRPLAHHLASEFGQPFIIDNRPGAGGTVAHAYVARSRADGQTLLMSTNSTYAIAPHLYQLTYDPDAAFAPIALLATTPQVLCIHRSVPTATPADLIAHLRRHPGQLAYSSAGIGFTSHLAAELFLSMSGTSMLHVPYRGGGPAIQAVATNEVQLNFSDTATALAIVQTGEVRTVAVTTPQRLPLLPEVPTLSEAALPGYVSATDYALMAPAGTPELVLNKLVATTLGYLNLAETRAKLAAQGFVPAALTPEAFREHRALERAKWGDIIRGRGIRVP